MLDLRYRLYKLRERLANKIIWKLPSWVIYRSAIRIMANATTGKYKHQVVPDLTMLDALKRWEK